MIFNKPTLNATEKNITIAFNKSSRVSWLRIIANAPIAVKLCKDAINRGTQVDIDSAIKVEAEDFGKCFDSEDQLEGMTAFLEKRAKNFQNR